MPHLVSLVLLCPLYVCSLEFSPSFTDSVSLKSWCDRTSHPRFAFPAILCQSRNYTKNLTASCSVYLNGKAQNITVQNITSPAENDQTKVCKELIIPKRELKKLKTFARHGQFMLKCRLVVDLSSSILCSTSTKVCQGTLEKSTPIYFQSHSSLNPNCTPQKNGDGTKRSAKLDTTLIPTTPGLALTSSQKPKRGKPTVLIKPSQGAAVVHSAVPTVTSSSSAPLPNLHSISFALLAIVLSGLVLV